MTPFCNGTWESLGHPRVSRGHLCLSLPERGGEGAGQTEAVEGRKVRRVWIQGWMERRRGTTNTGYTPPQLGLTPLLHRGKFGPRATAHSVIYFKRYSAQIIVSFRPHKRDALSKIQSWVLGEGTAVCRASTAKGQERHKTRASIWGGAQWLT